MTITVRPAKEVWTGGGKWMNWRSMKSKRRGMFVATINRSCVGGVFCKEAEGRHFMVVSNQTALDALQAFVRLVHQFWEETVVHH